MSTSENPHAVPDGVRITSSHWAGALHDTPDNWSNLVDQIVQLEELIADLREDREAASTVAVRKLDAMLREKRTRLKAIDVGA